jgi:hypothetical protein
MPLALLAPVASAAANVISAAVSVVPHVTKERLLVAGLLLSLTALIYALSRSFANVPERDTWDEGVEWVGFVGASMAICGGLLAVREKRKESIERQD